MSSAARGNASLAPGSHIWFESLEFIIAKEGDDLDLVPTDQQACQLPRACGRPTMPFRRAKEHMAQQIHPPGLPRAARSYHNKKVRRPSTNAHHLSPKAGEVPEDLPQQLGHAIVDTLASTETSSNSDFDDDYQGSTGFTKLQKMQRFLHVSDYLLNDQPLDNDFIDCFNGYELSWS
jgi:hypothetical protein